MKATRLLPAFLLSVLGGGLAHGGVLVLEANLDGLSESPPNASQGTGFAKVTYDSGAQTLHVQVTFSGLSGTTTASHIHAATAVPGAGTAGVATTVPTFTGFPLGVTSGTYDHTFDLTDASSFNPTFVSTHGGTLASAEAALVAAFNDGEAYLNIHTTVVPSGEIRGFLTAVPEPTSTAMVAAAMLGVFALTRRARAQGAR